jgi:hypothetical protein
VCKVGGGGPTETHEMLRVNPRHEHIDDLRVFTRAEEEVEHGPRGRQPTSTTNPKLMAKKRNLLAGDSRFTLWTTASQLNVNNESMKSIIITDLGMRKICAKFVPHNLGDVENFRRPGAYSWCRTWLQQTSSCFLCWNWNVWPISHNRWHSERDRRTEHQWRQVFQLFPEFSSTL